MRCFHPYKTWLKHTTIGGGSDHMIKLDAQEATNPWDPETLSEMMGEGDLDDPLLRFTEKREKGEKEQYSETVSLSPLLASAGAAAEFLQDWGFVRERFSSLLAKA